MRRLSIWSVGVVLVLASVATSCSRIASSDEESSTTITTDDATVSTPTPLLGTLTATLSLNVPLDDDDAPLFEDLIREELSNRFNDVAVSIVGDAVTIVIPETTEVEATTAIGVEGPVRSSGGTESAFPVQIVNISYDFTPDSD